MAERFDTTGFFWDDYVAPRVPVEKIKREPPDAVWLREDYLPGLEEARAYQWDLLTDNELADAYQARDRFVWDTEFYPNYALIGFKSITSGKIVKFEFHEGETCPLREKLIWILTHFTLIGFNDNAFDIPMTHAVLAGHSTEMLMRMVSEIISGGELHQGLKPQEFYRHYRLKPKIKIDNIDVIELTPLGPSLKICSGRLHMPRMADLPYPAGKRLSEDQITILRHYWVNDLDNTLGLYQSHKAAIELREVLTVEYGVDVRSKSDPQIAESVIRTEIRHATGSHPERAVIIPGRKFRYYAPQYLNFASENMRWVLDFIKQQDFVIDDRGGPLMPPALEKLDVPIGNATYRMGIGGLHSQEKHTVHFADDSYEITDNDVTSYYPSLMINQGMYPPNVGPIFLSVFKRLYDRRIAAKRAGDKKTAETLKIVLNGTFGKTGERGGYSVVYYPEMMIQVTVTGQLSLLLLIEMFEMNGIQVISANTDGVTVKCHRSKLDLKQQIIDQWQATTGLELESTPYKAVYSRDINNYLAIKPDGSAKAVGAYRATLGIYPLKWNPTCDVCAEAVIKFLATGAPIEQSIRQEKDFRKFVEVRAVRGGACKDGVYLGKAIRWYYALGVEDEIINAKNGHIVPRSKGARPCMVLPSSIPDDIDWQYYIERALGILEDVSQPPKKKEKITVAHETAKLPQLPPPNKAQRLERQTQAGS